MPGMPGMREGEKKVFLSICFNENMPTNSNYKLDIYA